MFFLLGSTFFIWNAVFAETAGMLTVSFLDVGQGDAIFIESPSGHQLLVDAGPGISVLRELGSVMGSTDRTVDVVVATHPDADHIGGFPEIFKRYEVSAVIDNGAFHDTNLYEQYNASIEKEHAQYIQARRGQVIDFGDGAYVRVLFPDRELGAESGNDGSVVLQVVYGETEVLLSGDAGKSVESHMVVLENKLLQSDVLKVGHHGSRTSSLQTFVATVAPTFSIISAECNSRYGHPHPETMEILKELSKEILTTCEEGTISFVSDGARFVRK